MAPPKESNILKIVKEDILRVLGEKKEKKVSVKFIDSEIDVSDVFLQKAIKELEREGLIQSFQDYILLTEKGKSEAGKIMEKHLILEKYFKTTRTGEEAHKMAHLLEHYISTEVLNDIKELSTLKAESVPLIKFELNRKGVIGDIDFSDYELFERVVSMGVFPGEKIRIINKIPNGVIVNIKNKKFAIGRDIAERIKVLEYEKS